MNFQKWELFLAHPLYHQIHFSSMTAKFGWLFEALGLVVDGKRMTLSYVDARNSSQLKTHYLPCNLRKSIPRFDTCISYTFQTIFKSIC